ncbi:hypothetical protein C5167_020066 [Papaver somniferum]|uniref:Plastocyanin-like domain-containing protein n=1 Tax=Papaver somniferum TaxID=3469 RepID=A0A4Y7IRY8_PAPSO|nr:uncharacterized protein LOC113354103 [Papaver somniferum]RZC51644.1 hypothetical protein C5167_020066 [Papaver somniferum]
MGFVRKIVLILAVALCVVSSTAEFYNGTTDEQINGFAFAPAPFSIIPVDPSTEILVNWTATLTNLTCYRIVGTEETVCRVTTSAEFHNITSGEFVSGPKSAGAPLPVPAMFLVFVIFIVQFV